MSNRQPGVGHAVPPGAAECMHAVIRQAIKLITGCMGLVKDFYILVYKSPWPSIELPSLMGDSVAAAVITARCAMLGTTTTSINAQ